MRAYLPTAVSWKTNKRGVCVWVLTRDPTLTSLPAAWLLCSRVCADAADLFP